MTADERQFLLTAAWLFMRHGQRARARSVCGALSEDDPRDGTVAVALAELLVDDGAADQAIETLRSAVVPKSLAHAEAVLETRALRLMGRVAEARSRWNRYLESRKGASRQWMA